MDHHGDATRGQCLGMTAEINVFSFWRNAVSDGADWTSAAVSYTHLTLPTILRV